MKRWLIALVLVLLVFDLVWFVSVRRRSTSPVATLPRETVSVPPPTPVAQEAPAPPPPAPTAPATPEAAIATATVGVQALQDADGAPIVAFRLLFINSTTPPLTEEPAFVVENAQGKQVYSGKFQFG